MSAEEDKDKAQTISKLFDKVYDDYSRLVEDTENTSSTKGQELLLKTIKALETLTVNVSMLDMFSRNENLNEVIPSHLKFLLLPHMLGSLWQLNTKEKRKDICRISKVYFKDFLKRCGDYQLWEGEVSEVEEDGEEEEEKKEKVKKKKKQMDPDDRRKAKVERFKRNRELDDKVLALRKYMERDEEDASPYAREIYVAMIKRAVNDAEEQLDSIDQEVELIGFQEQRMKDRPAGMQQAEPPPQPSQPLKPFIITKNAAQKAVYGMGYPALPIMTVEELYQQRRETGQWGPPPAPGQVQDPEEKAEEEERMKEQLEEADDETELARKRGFDDYKDDHRRGWGNRFNRS